jgi:RNA polymerase sigma-70 factor (ECF subfamily)
MLRVEMGFTYPEIAQAIGAPSANAARMTVVRALARLAEAMNARS